MSFSFGWRMSCRGFLRKSSSEIHFLRPSLSENTFSSLTLEWQFAWVLNFSLETTFPQKFESITSLMSAFHFWWWERSLGPLWFPSLCVTCFISGSFWDFCWFLMFLGGGHLAPSALGNISVLFLDNDFSDFSMQVFLISCYPDVGPSGVFC